MLRRFIAAIKRLVVGGERETTDQGDEPPNVEGDVPQVSAPHEINLEKKKLVRSFARIENKRLKLNHQEYDEDEPSSVEEDDSDGSSSSSSSLDTPSANPTARKLALENPVILHHLFQLCPAPVLASYRLVSKLWFEESLVTWRKAFPITVRPPLTEFLEFNNEPGNHCSTKPFRNIKLVKGQFNIQSDEYRIFRKTIGSNLTTLNMFRYTFNNVEEFRQLLYNCCPNLQNLGIFYCYFLTERASGTGGGDNEEDFEEHKHLKSLEVKFGSAKFPVTWTEIFSHFPFLTSFQILCIEDSEFESLIEAIRIVRLNDKKKLPFKSFQFCPLVTITRKLATYRKCVLAKELRLPVTNVEVEVHPELNQRFLITMLEYLAQSVKNITIKQEHRDEDEEPIPVPTWFYDFPFGVQLNQLTTLKSRGDLLKSFEFLRCTPNLSTLTISDSRRREGIKQFTSLTAVISNTCQEELANVKMLRLTTLTLAFIVRNEDLQALFKWMPNVIKLEMVLDDKQFDMVCHNWKNMRELRVLGDRLTAQGVAEIEEGIEAKREGRVGICSNIINLKWLELLRVTHNFFPDGIRRVRESYF